MKNELRSGPETDRQSSKATNSEIVKALIVLIHDFFDHNPAKAAPGHPIEADYGLTIDESNLVPRISMALNAYRRQQDRMSDLMDGMTKIVSGQ